MKNYILCLILFFVYTINLTAQQRDEVNEKIEAQKVAYITTKLDLTAEEATEFWPLYNQFQKDKKAINKDYKSDQRIVNMSDTELEKQITSSFQRDQELLDLKKSYFEKMKKVLPIRKIAMLQMAEREFKTTILDMMKERRKERQRKLQKMRDN